MGETAADTNEGTEYEYWKTHKRLNRKKKLNYGDIYHWWLRSPFKRDTQSFEGIGQNVLLVVAPASQELGVCFGFCV